MNFSSFVELTSGNLVVAGRMIAELILHEDRAGALQVLRQFVESSTPEQLDEFESRFISAATQMATSAQRIRAIELYAYLKVVETAHYGEWRGFLESQPAVNERGDELVREDLATEAVIDEIPELVTVPWKNNAPEESSTIGDPIDQTIHRATEVMGNREKAMRWLGTPVRGLDFATPVSLLATVEGAQRVNDILGQMEHGTW